MLTWKGVVSQPRNKHNPLCEVCHLKTVTVVATITESTAGGRYDGRLPDPSIGGASPECLSSEQGEALGGFPEALETAREIDSLVEKGPKAQTSPIGGGRTKNGPVSAVVSRKKRKETQLPKGFHLGWSQRGA